MEQIEVNIKLASNNQVYNLPIRKSESIIKLKEYCQIISNIPQDQQILLYKGKMLLNEKLIKDYDIENNQEIILAKREEQKPMNIGELLDSANNNKEINPKEIAKSIGSFPNLLSFCEQFDFDKCANYFRLMGIENSSQEWIAEMKEFKEKLKDPLVRDYIKNITPDTSFLEEAFSVQKIKDEMQNNPFLKSIFQNPQKFCTPQAIQSFLNMYKVNEKNEIESSCIGNSIPPDPFGSLNSNQSSQIMNSSGEISNINSFNNNSIKNKEIFRNNEINIDYKKEFKDQLSQLKDMGFTNEEINIQALKQSKGNTDIAIEKLLKYN